MPAADWTKESFDKMRHTGDESADYTIDTLFEGGTARVDQVSQLLQDLIRNDEIPRANLPPEVREYLDKSGELPDWRNPELIKQGEQLFEENGLAAFAILGCASLPESYAIPDATRVLGLTQQLQGHVHRRIIETSQFVVDVMSKDGLGEKGRGIRSTQKVRLMHAAIRYLIRFDPGPRATLPPQPTFAQVLRNYSWPADWGTPIHQVAMSAAILSFSFIVLRALDDLGVELTCREKRAYLHCWNVVGHVMGVDSRLLLKPGEECMEEARLLYDRIWDNAKKTTCEGTALEGALLRYLEGLAPWWVVGPFRHIPRMLTVRLVGEHTAELIGVKVGRWDRLILGLPLKVLRAANRLARSRYARFPEERIAAERLFRRILKALLRTDRGGNRGFFRIPTELADSWRRKGVRVPQERGSSTPTPSVS